jgi:hypothetical protein
MLKRVRNIFWLASRDFANEWQMSGFFVLALAAVLGPMMILFGLKFGIVGSMLDNLIQDPRNREIHPVGSGRFDMAWVEQLRERPEIGFVIPHTRSIAEDYPTEKRILEPYSAGGDDPYRSGRSALVGHTVSHRTSAGGAVGFRSPQTQRETGR